MYKEFHCNIPLSLEDSFNLLRQSGADLKWRANSLERKNGFIAWKQGFWALTGTAAITATLNETKEDETSWKIIVSKPLQLFDPLGLCDKIFSKLDKAWQKNLSSSKKWRKKKTS
jgi:hypothetical protein